MSSATSPRTLRERMINTINSFMAAYEDASLANDASLINRDSTPDCARHLLPACVPRAFNLPTDFSFDNAGIEAAIATDLKVLKFEDVVISNLVVDTEALRAAFTSVSRIRPIRADAGERYEAEASWTLYLTEDGGRVRKAIEFCDKDVLLRMAGESA